MAGAKEIKPAIWIEPENALQILNQLARNPPKQRLVVQSLLLQY
jgi:hypothetical protein